MTDIQELIHSECLMADLQQEIYIGATVRTYDGKIGTVMSHPWTDHENGEQLCTVEVEGRCYPHGTADLEIVTLEQEEAELQAQLARIDAFFAYGFVTGEDIWWHGPVSPVKAVYLCERDGKAGIALLVYNDPWLPHTVDFEKISGRLDD